MTKERVAPVSASRVLVLLSILLLFIAGYNVWRYSGPAYFALTGRPLNLEFWSHSAVHRQVLPDIAATETVAQPVLPAGSVQTITVTVSSRTTIPAYIEAWITSPKNKQVWRSPTKSTTLFRAGKSVVVVYSYVLPTGLPPGVYKASLILASADSNTDYLVKEGIAEFKVT